MFSAIKTKMITVKEKIAFSHEKNGFYELDNCVLSRIVNDIGKDIIVDINEGHDLAYIADKYCDEYFTRKDLYIFLSDLRNMNYIDFEDSFFADLCKEQTVKIAGEKEYMRISKCIENNTDVIVYPETFKKEYYNVMTLRTRGFYNKENLLYEEDEGEITAIIGVRGFNVVKSPVIISLLMYGKNGLDSLVAFYKKVEEFFVMKQKRKVKVLFETKEISPQMMDFLNKSGFIFEAELKCEDGDKDLIIYSKLLEINK